MLISWRLRRRIGQGGLCTTGRLPSLSVFLKCAEKLGWFRPLNRQDQVNADYISLIPWCQWYEERKCSHLQHINSAVMVCICEVQLRHPDRTLDRVRLPYRLQDAGGGLPKLQQICCVLPVGGIVDAGHVIVWMCQHVEDQARTVMCLRHRHNVGELQLLLKQSYCVYRKEDYTEAILNPLLHLPPYEFSHILGAFQGVWTLGDGGLQSLERPRGPGMFRDALFYIVP